jgi:hypothetical protein
MIIDHSKVERYFDGLVKRSLISQEAADAISCDVECGEIEWSHRVRDG